jgi:hypothetical protein
MEKQEEICCPKFNPEPWHNTTFEWHNKLFIKDKVKTFFYMPLNFGAVMRRLDSLIKKNNAQIPDWLCLSDHTSRWNMDLYLAVDKRMNDVNIVELSGRFFSIVYEGPFKDTDKWCKDFEAKAKERQLNINKWYMWYTTCPKCAKKYGKNYVVIIGKID